MHNINRTTRQESSWERFKENAADKVQVFALSFAKKMKPAIETIRSVFSTAKKTDAFFRKGVIGQALAKTTGLSVAEVAAAQGGAALATYPARAIGKIAGASLVQTLSTATLVTGAVHLASYAPGTANFQNLRQASIWKGILTLVGLSTLIGLYINYKNDLEGMGEGLGSAIFEHLGSIVGSIIAGYQVSKLSSGLSFEEYLKRNVQQLGAVAVFNFAFAPNPWVKMPYDLIVGMLAYNAGPIKELIRMVHRNMVRREKDIALRIQQHLQSEQEAKLTAARAEREAALQRGEDVTTHDGRIRELERSSIVLRGISTNLDHILNNGFKSLIEYQDILTNSDSVASAQLEFVEVYQKAGNFEKKCSEEGIESTNEYRQALQSNPDIAERKEAFARDLLQRYELEKTEKRSAFEEALKSAVNEKISWVARGFNAVARHITDSSVLPMLDSIPKISSIEETLFGFNITDSVSAEIAETLMRTHMRYYLALSSLGITLEAGTAIRRTIFGERPRNRILMTTNEELRLIEGLLKLVVSHYERSIPDSTTAKWVGNALPIVFTGLREGVRPAFQEWRSRNESGELVQPEDPTVLTHEDYIPEFEMLTDEDMAEFREAEPSTTGVDAPEETILDMTDADMLDDQEIAEARQANPAATDNGSTAVDMGEDDGIGRSLSVESEEDGAQTGDDETYFDAKDNLDIEEPDNFVDATDGANPEETILDMAYADMLDDQEIAEARQAPQAPQAGPTQRQEFISKISNIFKWGKR